MVATAAIMIGLGLLITTTVSADEAQRLVAERGGHRVGRTVIVVSQAVTQLDDGRCHCSVRNGSSCLITGEDFEFDPWEGFNEKMFWFNREVLDRYVLKPPPPDGILFFPIPCNAASTIFLTISLWSGASSIIACS